jgi:hypothetical protein
MRIVYVYGQPTALAARAVLLLTLSLSGCATSTAGSSLMDARAEAPAPPKISAYLPVEDLPPERKMMPADEQLKLKSELIAARERQAAKAQGSAAAAKSTKPQAVQPTNQAVRQ